MTSTSARPRVRMTGAQRRQQLLDIGRELFGQRGFEATSIEEIAARADVSKPVVYEHFGGKEGLYAVVVDREMQLLLDRFTSALSAPGHPRELLERAALVLLEYIEDDTDGFRVLTRDAPVTSGVGTFSSLIGEVARKVEHILGAQFDRRGYDPQLRRAVQPGAGRHGRAGRPVVAGHARRRTSTRWPRTWSTWPTTAWPTSNPAGPSPDDPRRGEPASRQPSQAGAGHRAVHGPDRAEDPRAGQLGGQPDRRRARRAASAATVGPEPLTSAASAPASVAARSARPQLRAAAPGRAPAGRWSSAAGQCGRRPAAERGDDRVRRRQLASPSGTGPARAQPVQLGVDGRAWTAPRRRCRAPSADARARPAPARAAPRDRCPSATPPCRLNGTSLPSWAASAVEVARGRPGCPRARRGRPAPPRRRRCHRPGRRPPGSTCRSRSRRRRARRRARPAARRRARPGCAGRWARPSGVDARDRDRRQPVARPAR